MYAIMDATGPTGGAALTELRRRGIRVRALARDPERAARLWDDGVELVIAAPDDVEALTAAFAGIDAAFVTPSPRKPTAAIAQALVGADVRHVVAVSPRRASPDFEDALLATGASVTFVRVLDDARQGRLVAGQAGRLAARCLMEARS